MNENKFLPKLSQNLLEILDDDEYYDITIEVGNDPYVRIFRAHIIILNYRSPYLRRILSTNKKKNDETLVNIKLPNILPETFQIILRYIYGGKILLEECDTSDIIKILISANELSLQELVPHLQSFLIRNKTNWLEQNLSSIYQLSFENDSFLDLRMFCTNLISEQPEKIFNSPDFTSIPEKCLISIIQNNNIDMSTVQVWDYVLKWGVAQNPELSSDYTSFSNDDFNALRNTLQKCISFIGFTDFTHKEFLHKVHPYKKIIPEEMYESLIEYFLDHDCNQPEPRIIRGISNQSDINSNPRIIGTSNQGNDNQEPSLSRVIKSTSNQNNDNPDPEIFPVRGLFESTSNQNNDIPDPEVFSELTISRRTSNQSNDNPEPEILPRRRKARQRKSKRASNQSNNNPEPGAIPGLFRRSIDQSDKNPEPRVIPGSFRSSSNRSNNNPIIIPGAFSDQSDNNPKPGVIIPGAFSDQNPKPEVIPGAFNDQSNNNPKPKCHLPVDEQYSF
ncbi:uncharacterized protein OCT59_021258 [Rhizophagus irregularis]|uniref:uncharacterized protein n=1 Tax=Rhizophagus irregularis TaxID=588596 RepID=UPI0033287129|nr:hypothetical protein OCT59_021258 [Rhizophagus irregularis]